MPKFRVTISQSFSEQVTVTAKNSQDAKMKGWKKFNPKKMNYKIYADKEEF